MNEKFFWVNVFVANKLFKILLQSKAYYVQKNKLLSYYKCESAHDTQINQADFERFSRFFLNFHQGYPPLNFF